MELYSGKEIGSLQMKLRIYCLYDTEYLYAIFAYVCVCVCVLVSRLSLSVSNHNHTFDTGLCLHNEPHNDSHGVAMVTSIPTLLDVIWITWTDKLTHMQAAATVISLSVRLTVHFCHRPKINSTFAEQYLCLICVL